MKTNRKSSVALAFVVALCGVLVTLALVGSQACPVSADVVTYYSTSTLFSGGTGYTTTATSALASSADYGTVQVQVHNVVSGTGVLTVTPQFSIEPGTCANARYWFTATAYRLDTSLAESTTSYADDVTVTTGTKRITTTVTSSVTPALVQLSRSYQFTVATSGDVMMTMPTAGACFRVVVASAGSRYTPTVYARMVDMYE